MKTQQQLYAEIYEIVKGQDLSQMRDIVFKMFKKKSIHSLYNDQLVQLIPYLKKAYERQA